MEFPKNSRLENTTFLKEILDTISSELEERLTDPKQLGGVYTGEQVEKMLESIKGRAPIQADRVLVDFIIGVSDHARLTHEETDDLLDRLLVGSDKFRGADRLAARDEQRAK